MTTRRKVRGDFKAYIRTRDRHKCRICESRGDDLLVAHIWPVTVKPELRNDASNALLLCERCELEYGDKYHHYLDGTAIPVLREMFPYDEK